VGYLQSTALAIPSARYHLLQLYADLNAVPGWHAVSVRLSNKSLNELQHFWADVPSACIGRSWYPPETSFLITATLVTDASQYAWGSHLHLH
jgi:hypothetical protein